MSPGDRVRPLDVLGARGRVLAVEGDRVLVRWDGYTLSPCWVEVVKLQCIEVRS